MEEKLIEKTLVRKVEKLGGLAIKLLSFLFTGLPDRMILMPGGRIWFVELKTTGKKPTLRQEIVHVMLRKLGFQVHVIDNALKLDLFIQLISQ